MQRWIVRPWASVFGVLACIGLNVSTASASPCAARFADFIREFERDATFRLEHIRFPLALSYVDSADLESSPKLIEVSREMYTSGRAAYPTPEIQAERHLEKEISDGATGNATVRFQQPDSDAYSKDFQFEKRGTCWQLVSVSDASL